MKQWICVLCCVAMLCVMVGCAEEKSGLPSSESKSDSSRERSEVSSFESSLEDSSVEERSEDSSGEELFSPSKNDVGIVRVRRFINGKGLQELSCEEAREFEDFLVSAGYRHFFLTDDDVLSNLDMGGYWVSLSGFDFRSLQKEAELQNWYLDLRIFS